ncbi:Aste57867_6576 [Aphanomyces stellatus]|uniref:Aste57867_6576 protein n=1 Tax=Aphanomyces stellatus TaxID=120398 RepID=A0A485KEW0_9STRA|nr:hypothetical protein As57867_006559 [Aphanomyces stellatus]VFT83557.1 Aste57867_6576 [Aphanomyces stellatus]
MRPRQFAPRSQRVQLLLECHQVRGGVTAVEETFEYIARRLDAPAPLVHVFHPRSATTKSTFSLHGAGCDCGRNDGVIDDVRAYLMALEKELDALRHNFNNVTLRDVHNELGKLPRVIKPTRDVPESLLDSRDLPETTKTYLRDVYDHLKCILDEIELQFQICRDLMEEYREAKATQMNYVVYTLTIVTTVFLPAQFLTGVYGMDFGTLVG